MSTLVAEEELESTRGERLLALLFGMFLSVGLLWGYLKIHNRLVSGISDPTDRTLWLVFVLRMLYVLATLGISFWLMARYRRRAGRRMPLVHAGLGATTLLTLVMAIDYLSEYINLFDLGPLLLSAVGVALSLAAFIALQRTLVRRVPGRRVRRGECPFCGYPVRASLDGPSCCEGCGRDVIGECTVCQHPRRVGTPHCGSCGTA